MLGLRQTFPAWGTLDARGRAAAEDAGSAQDATRARRQEVAAQVRRAYATYYGADQEVRLHLEHIGLTSRVLELARLNQRTGHGRLQDVLRLELELTRVHTDVARIERQQRSSRALLNALMDRPSDAPLGPPEDLSVTPTTDITGLATGIDTNRPEIVAAARGVRRSEALLDGARHAARFPNVMVGLDYWYMPMFPDFQHAYGAMVAINLPWLSGRRRDEEREADRRSRPSDTRWSPRRTPFVTSFATRPRGSTRPGSRSRSSTRTCWPRRSGASTRPRPRTPPVRVTRSGCSRRSGRTCRCGSSGCRRWRSWRRARPTWNARREHWPWKAER